MNPFLGQVDNDVTLICGLCACLAIEHCYYLTGVISLVNLFYIKKYKKNKNLKILRFFT